MTQPGFVVLTQDAVERALEDATSAERLVARLRAERDALYTEVLRLGGDPSAILRGLDAARNAPTSTARTRLKLWALRPSGGKASRCFTETICGGKAHAEAIGYIPDSMYSESFTDNFPIVDGDIEGAQEKAAAQLEDMLRKEGVLDD